MRTGHIILAALAISVAVSGSGRTLLTQDDALLSAFPKGAKIERQTVFLEPSQLEGIRELSGHDVQLELVIRYIGRKDGQIVGYAYFDAHRVRTLPETIMIVVRPDGSIDKVEILTFSEPMDYFPKRRWLDQFLNRPLDDELSLNHAIRPISGATLTGRAITNASRRILAIHEIVGRKK